MSVREWKKMRRKQQEIVFNVWEKMLETMKFRAAEKSDFGTNLHGLHAPKDTPFDTALAALKEMCGGKPNYFEPCPGCVFLGSYKSGPPSMEGPDLPEGPTQYWRDFVPKEEQRARLKDTWYDLYFCNQGHKIKKPMLSARFGDAPKPSDSYSEGETMRAIFNPDSTVGQDLRYISAPPDKCRHPVLRRARDMACELDLIPEGDWNESVTI